MPSNIPYPTQMQAGRAVDSPIGAGIINKRVGSLAEACSLLNAEVEQLEAATKNLFERTTPFLEQTQPTQTAPQPGEGRAGSSPLAESIFEYVGRIRRQREGLEEMAARIAY